MRSDCDVLDDLDHHRRSVMITHKSVGIARCCRQRAECNGDAVVSALFLCATFMLLVQAIKVMMLPLATPTFAVIRCAVACAVRVPSCTPVADTVWLLV